MAEERGASAPCRLSGDGGFTREDSRIVKGAAIVMMLFHHLAGFEKRFPVGFPGFTTLIPQVSAGGYLHTMASFGKMCVPIFFFLGGYGLYMQWSEGRLSVKKHIVSLYKVYWKMFLVFVPIAYLFFARTGADINELCTRFVITSKKDLITTLVSNFTGLRYTINNEWWFFRYYVFALPLGACFCSVIQNSRSFWRDFFLVVCLEVFFSTILPDLSELPAFQAIRNNLFYIIFKDDGHNFIGAFFAGIVFAKYGGIGLLKNEIGKVRFKRPLCLFGCFVIFWCFGYSVGAGGMLLYTPLLVVFVSVFFDGLMPLRRLLGFLGKHSTNMWLIHTFFCYYFLEATKLVYCTTSVWIDLLILTAMSLAGSVLLELFWKYAEKGWLALTARRKGSA